MKIFAISIHIIHNYCKKDIFSSKMRKTEITHKNRKLMKTANIFLSNNKKKLSFRDAFSDRSYKQTKDPNTCMAPLPIDPMF